MTFDRMEWHLGNWSEWMHIDSHKLGYPSKSACMLSGGASGEDEFEIMCETADIQCAMSLDSLMHSLSQPQTVAINHAWLNNRHHYPTHELDYVEAVERLMYLANKRGLQ